MKLSLIQRVKRDDGTRWVEWAQMMPEPEFTEIMKYFMSSMIPGWYENDFIIGSLDENTLTLLRPEKWLIEHGLLRKEPET